MTFSSSLVLRSLTVFFVTCVSLLFMVCSVSLVLGITGIVAFHTDMFFALLLGIGGLLLLISIISVIAIKRLEKRLDGFSPYGRSSNKYFRQTYVLPRHSTNQYAHVRMVAFTQELQKIRNARLGCSYQDSYEKLGLFAIRQQVENDAGEEQRS